MSEVKHTPLPTALDRLRREIELQKVPIISAFGHLHQLTITPDEYAELVRHVNTLPTLVQALEESFEVADFEHRRANTVISERDAMRKALEEAKECLRLSLKRLHELVPNEDAGPEFDAAYARFTAALTASGGK